MAWGSRVLSDGKNNERNLFGSGKNVEPIQQEVAPEPKAAIPRRLAAGHLPSSGGNVAHWCYHGSRVPSALAGGDLPSWGVGPHKSQRRTAANVYFRSSPYDLAPRIILQPVIPADSSHVTSAKQCKNMFPNARGREQEGKDVFLFLKNVNSFRMFFFHALDIWGVTHILYAKTEWHPCTHAFEYQRTTSNIFWNIQRPLSRHVWSNHNAKLKKKNLMLL